MARGDGETALVTVVLPMILWVGTLVAIVSIDTGAYLVAAARAQQVADAAALAAVVVDAPGDGRRRAHGLARTSDAELVSCRCVPGSGRSSVEVAVTVPGLVLPRLGLTHVHATADAVLVPDADDARGPVPWGS